MSKIFYTDFKDQADGTTALMLQDRNNSLTSHFFKPHKLWGYFLFFESDFCGNFCKFFG